MSRFLSQHLQKILFNLPEQPGVYRFYDKNGKILYVGKAKNLRKRVGSYFTSKSANSFKSKILTSKIHDITYVVVDSESDALLLENNLIKKLQPRYNVLLKDDKSFPWICIKNEPFPRVFSTRNPVQDGSVYFGPYTSALMVRTLLDLIRHIYPLRTCNYQLTEENIQIGKYKVCLEYHLGNCRGPCEGLQNHESYSANIAQIKQILKGNLGEVIEFLKGEMNRFAGEYRFEEAGQMKKKVDILKNFQSKSTIVNRAIHNVDVFSIIDEEETAFVNYLNVVKGAVVQVHTVEMKKKLKEEPLELLLFAITDIRERIHSDAKELIVPMDISKEMPEYQITVPKIGDKKKLLELSERNARAYRLEKKRKQAEKPKVYPWENILKRLQKDLMLNQMPVHIECFDNSNMQGTHPVAACVVFRKAKPAKSEYRHYHIKTVEGPDDYASMEEIVYRRYRRLKEESKPMPQLIVIDGGKGQLNAALSSLENLGLRGSIAVIGIAKKLEEIYFPEDPVPLFIDKNSPSLKLLQHLRNEAHRFGIEFHRSQRSKSMTQSVLETIPGIGQKTIQRLFGEFKSVGEIRNLSEHELADRIGKTKASALYRHLHIK